MLQPVEQVIPIETTKRLKVGRLQVSLIIFIILAISACEYIFTYQNVTYGIVCALALTLLIYLVISIFNIDNKIASCAESLALVPLYILFTSSIPWFLIDQQYLLPMVYTCILGLCFWHVYQNKLNLSEIFSFRKEKILKYSLIGLVIGIPTGTIEYLVLQPAQTLPYFSIVFFLRDLIYMLVFVALGEELLFRGLIQANLATVFGWKWALFGTSLLFAVMHLTWRSIPELVFVFIAGLIFGGLYLKTKSLVAPIVMHGINNTVLVAIVPYILG
ncbi:lysostaphin resistance A-like protein [Chloroflexota bacterium]